MTLISTPQGASQNWAAGYEDTTPLPQKVAVHSAATNDKCESCGSEPRYIVGSYCTSCGHTQGDQMFEGAFSLGAL